MDHQSFPVIYGEGGPHKRWEGHKKNRKKDALGYLYGVYPCFPKI